jgi:hypothetical protein
MKKRSKIISAVVVLILVITGTYLYAQDLFLSPEQKLIRATENFSNLGSYTIEADINSELIGGNESSVNFKINSDLDRVNKEARGFGQINFTMEGAAAKIGASYTYANDDLYVGIDTFPYLFLPLDANQVELIVENDILVKENLIEDTNNYLADLFKEKEREPKTIEEIITEIESYSQEVWQEEAIRVRKVEEDIIDGENVEKYTLSFDGQKINDIYLRIVEDYQLFDFFPNLSEEEVEEMKKEIEEQMKESYETVEAYVWIDNGNFVKSKTVSRTPIEVDPKTIAEQEVELPEEILVTSNIYYKNFDQQFDIEAPTEFITIQKLLNELNAPALLQVFFNNRPESK